jgi:hypothetical protein
MTPEEQLAASFAISLRDGRMDDGTFDGYKDRFPELWERYELLVEELVSLGLLEKRNYTLVFTWLGRLFEDEILSRFYSPSVQDRLRAPC